MLLAPRPASRKSSAKRAAPSTRKCRTPSPPELYEKEPGLAACYAAAAQGFSVSGDRAGPPPLRLVVSVDAKPPTDDLADPVAKLRGINVHARQIVDGRDRRQLERLARCITRPPIAQDRLTERPDGTLELALKSTWKDGTRAIVFSPEDLVLRLIAAIPPPRWHLLRYFGVLRVRRVYLASEPICRPSPTRTRGP